MKNTKTLYNAVKAQRGHTSFHTPGHKFRCPELEELIAADTTEISATDELYHPFGPIVTAEKEAAETFGVKEACFSAGGATLCIQTALSFYAGKKVLAERGCHISVINASALLDIDLRFVYGDIHPTFGFAMPITAEKLEKALSEGGYSAVVITSPDYYGLCADVKALREVCDRYGCHLITDNSHGSHLSLAFPENEKRQTERYSHFTVNSLHKTLPVLTGGAMLCSNLDIPKSVIKQNMALFGSTSPSFPILASIDFGVAYAARNGAAFAETAKKVAKLRQKLTAHGLEVLDTEEGECLRLCINVHDFGYEAEALEEELKKINAYPEIASGGILLFLFSPFNGDGDFSELCEFFRSLPRKTPIKEKPFVLAPSVRAVSLREALLAEKESVPCSEAAGRISAETFSTCPPGMAITVSGEYISPEAAERLAAHKKYTEVLK